ncbi:hypothetical protein [Sphingopyxis sp. 550A]
MLRWVKDGQFTECWHAMSGNLEIGHVLRRSIDGQVVYKVDAVSTRWITKGHGEVASIASGKRAIERAWQAWCNLAGLQSSDPGRT